MGLGVRHLCLTLAGCVTLEKTLPSLAQGGLCPWLCPAAGQHYYMGWGLVGLSSPPGAVPTSPSRIGISAHSVILKTERATEDGEEGGGGVQSLKR